MHLPEEAFFAHSWIRYVILIANWKSAGGSSLPENVKEIGKSKAETPYRYRISCT
jgi:hypothetical protein